MALYWRVFPWDPDVNEGNLFSPSYIPPTTGRGRFDLPVACSPVLYVAESPEHAIAEAIQPWRNRPLRGPHLLRAGRPLALVGVQLDPDESSRLLDLCDPRTLHRHRLKPDRIASRRRRTTQPIAASAWDGGHAGLRWWSSFWGEWHGVVLFAKRVRRNLRFGEPEVISRDTPALREAAGALGMTVAI
ncbi:MAG: RES family NAD+ phosphorylase [Gemmatimonadetes bacterium]|nr:RES family NAD+ phosphorylase [Gemmatimonadota bacterium]MYA11652.1 RES family NAD+ phosphorylase [Gemmatimonadota bacterium]MYD12876.1 RES family NAD+ phosphorylase [Gemmatimonadota bacterium]MYE71570.1 RES family NAD+ phosphorylase [Gemmatimonadota bacterium]MYI64857.1 RES family NAD+ phosphorylase [Gemmatimonadota bacterium]